MSKIAIVGGGIAGLTAAVELAAAGNRVLIIEKGSEIGGNVESYGCKAVDICTKCNLCLVDDIINDVSSSKNIEILYRTSINDFRGKTGDYTLGIETDGELYSVDNLEYIVLATGFTKWSELETGTPEAFKDNRILWASELEESIKNRIDRENGQDVIDLGYSPESVVFIQCNGSRNMQEKARYCSRICCGYNYRMARVLKHYYPEVDINMFYMDIQEGGFIQDISFSDLAENDIGCINCKPVRIEKNDNNLILHYENQLTGKTESIATDLIVLSEGVHANEVNEKWADLFNLQIDDYGFLMPIESEEQTGIFLAGTVKGPKDIAGTISDSKNIAYRIKNARNLSKSGG